MEKIADSNFVRPLLRGEVVLNPAYLQQELEEYENNPFIEALPRIMDDDDVIERFFKYPQPKGEELNQRKNVRFHMIKRLKQFTIPLEECFIIERSISIMIRWGYMARNPCNKEFFERLQALNDVKEEKVEMEDDRFKEITESLKSTADGFSIIGISGIGKTTAIERILKMYPQVIHHHHYKGVSLTRTQIVWLKIDCPYDGSVKTLCKMFFKAIDDILGTKYLSQHGKNSNSAATMMIHMAYLSSLHGIGVLVIDEMQHLIKKKKEISSDMLNFFVTLINIIGIPIVLIGTYKALQVLSQDFRQARRAASEGDVIWDRMQKGKQWDLFLETLWAVQWLKEPTPLTEELKDLIYEESQGITAVAVNLFILAQSRALFTVEEKITKQLIKHTAQMDLFIIQPMIQALRDNNTRALKEYEDVSVDIDKILDNAKFNMDLRGEITKVAEYRNKLRNFEATNLQEKLLAELSVSGMFTELNNSELEAIAQTTVKEQGIAEEYPKVLQAAVKLALVKNQEKEDKKKVNSEKIKPVIKGKDDLRKIFKKATKDKTHVYELLKDQGYIKDPLEEFLVV